MRFVKRHWTEAVFAIAIVASIAMMVSLDPRLSRLPSLFWASAGAKAVAVFFLTYGLYCIFMGDGSETDIVGIIPAICIGSISYVLFSYPLLGKVVGAILGLIVLTIALDKAGKYLSSRRNKVVPPDFTLPREVIT